MAEPRKSGRISNPPPRTNYKTLGGKGMLTMTEEHELEEKKSIRHTKDLIMSDITNETIIKGTYLLCTQYNTDEAGFHFLVYLINEVEEKAIRFSHYEGGKNLIEEIKYPGGSTDLKILGLEESDNDTIIDMGKFSCKRNEIYKRGLSLWSLSDNIEDFSKTFPSSCSGFSVCLLIHISDEFSAKIINYMKEYSKELSNALNDLSKTTVPLSKDKVTKQELEQLRQNTDCKYVAKRPSATHIGWDLLIELYNAKKNLTNLEFRNFKDEKKRQNALLKASSDDDDDVKYEESSAKKRKLTRAADAQFKSKTKSKKSKTKTKTKSNKSKTKTKTKSKTKSKSKSKSKTKTKSKSKKSKSLKLKKSNKLKKNKKQ